MPKKATKQKKADVPAAVKAAMFAGPASKGKVEKKKTKKTPRSENPLFEVRPKNFGIGGDIQPKRDLTRFVRWPKYIKLQRQRRILLKRLKVPGVINQFNKTLDKHTAAQLFNFLEKYAPETKKQKKDRLVAAAKEGPEAGPKDKKPKFIKCGLNHVTRLIERKDTVKLVVIAHDVDPIEMVLWLPTLCRKKGVPYVIVKGKARLGKIVHKKTATCLAVTDIDVAKDGKTLENFVNKATEQFNNRLTDNMRAVGGGIMGWKHRTRKAKEERRQAKEKKKTKE